MSDKLLKDQEIEKLEEKLAVYESGRYGKKMLESPYGIFYYEGRLFAIYNNKGEQYPIAKGNDLSSLKLAQDLSTGEWWVLKTTTFFRDLTLCPGNFPNDKATLDYFKCDEKTLEYRQICFKNECQILYELGKSISSEYILREKKGENELLMSKGNILIRFEPGFQVKNWLNDPSLGADKLTTSDWIAIAIKIVEAVKELHTLNIIHCDLKLENILFDPKTGKVSIIDHGFAQKLSPGEKKIELPYFHGTPGHFAPELKAARENEEKRFSYSTASDVYALGATLLSLLLNNENKGALVLKESLALRTLVSDMLNQSPDKRPGLDEIIKRLKQLEDDEDLQDRLDSAEQKGSQSSYQQSLNLRKPSLFKSSDGMGEVSDSEKPSLKK